jgi:hypothetical protein
LDKVISYSLLEFNSFHFFLGQDVVAERALDNGSRDGHWVVLQNIHLVARWLPQLEKKLEQTAEVASEDFRVFLSAEPAPDPEAHVNDYLMFKIILFSYFSRFHKVFWNLQLRLPMKHQQECMQIFIKLWIILIKIQWNVVQKKMNSNQFYSLFVIFMLLLLNVENLDPLDGIGS